MARSDTKPSSAYSFARLTPAHQSPHGLESDVRNHVEAEDGRDDSAGDGAGGGRGDGADGGGGDGGGRA